jgi:hypothetical protein
MQPPTRTLFGFGSTGLVCLLLAACGQSGAPAPQQDVSADPAAVSAVSDVSEARQGGRSGITAIDAALDDAAAMPDDSYGPTAYDLARARDGQSEDREDEPASRPSNAGEIVSESDDGAADAGGDPPAALVNAM